MDMSISKRGDEINWSRVLGKEVIGTGGLDLGIVHQVGDSYIIIQKGLITKKRYCIPFSRVKSFDGDILRLRVNETELKEFEETKDTKFKEYYSFKSSDMSREMETKIPVMGENLEVTKKIIEDKVNIIKEPVKETKVVEIDLTYEKVIIERRPVVSESDSETKIAKSTEQPPYDVEGPVKHRTEISIPLKREEPVIIKRPYIKEEIIVKKKPITETKKIVEEITHEEVKYGEEKKEDDIGVA